MTTQPASVSSIRRSPTPGNHHVDGGLGLVRPRVGRAGAERRPQTYLSGGRLHARVRKEAAPHSCTSAHPELVALPPSTESGS
jgi:hypothetical protein